MTISIGNFINWKKSWYLAVEESIFQKPIDLANFGIIIGGSESHQSATDFPTDPGGGKT